MTLALLLPRQSAVLLVCFLVRAVELMESSIFLPSAPYAKHVIKSASLVSTLLLAVLDALPYVALTILLLVDCVSPRDLHAEG